MQVANFADVFNIARVGYFHCCIIRDIKPHERHQTIFATFTHGCLMIKVPTAGRQGCIQDFCNRVSISRNISLITC